MAVCHQQAIEPAAICPGYEPFDRWRCFRTKKRGTYIGIGFDDAASGGKQAPAQERRCGGQRVASVARIELETDVTGRHRIAREIVQRDIPCPAPPIFVVWRLLGQEAANVSNLVEELAGRREVEAELVRGPTPNRAHALLLERNDMIPANPGILPGIKGRRRGSFHRLPAGFANHPQRTARGHRKSPCPRPATIATILQRPAVPMAKAHGGQHPLTPDVCWPVGCEIFRETPAAPTDVQPWYRDQPGRTG